MQSAQESLAELRAAIRYCENAISAAESTIESMDFRQQLAKQKSTEREKALDDENIHLQKVVIDLETFVEELQDDKVRLNRKVEALEAEVQELKDKVQGQPADIVQLKRDRTAKTAHANAWKAEAEKLRKELQNYESKQKLSKHE